MVTGDNRLSSTIMVKLVLLSAGMTGRTHELKVDKTTVGRVEDNTFQISEPSVSSHHCEVLLKGNDVFIKDLNSTNGTFINGEKVTESLLKPGQVLRLGQIEMRLESGSPGATAAPATGTPPPGRKPVDQTMVMQRGVKLDELEQGARPPGFDTAGKGFSKKTNKANRIIVTVGVILGVVILGLLLYAFTRV
jgi:pSer/pThr/pTyr-binding forkhead associated (FHA) protein